MGPAQTFLLVAVLAISSNVLFPNVEAAPLGKANKTGSMPWPAANSHKSRNQTDNHKTASETIDDESENFYKRFATSFCDKNCSSSAKSKDAVYCVLCDSGNKTAKGNKDMTLSKVSTQAAKSVQACNKHCTGNNMTGIACGMCQQIFDAPKEITASGQAHYQHVASVADATCGQYCTPGGSNFSSSLFICSLCTMHRSTSVFQVAEGYVRLYDEPDICSTKCKPESPAYKTKECQKCRPKTASSKVRINSSSSKNNNNKNNSNSNSNSNSSNTSTVKSLMCKVACSNSISGQMSICKACKSANIPSPGPAPAPQQQRSVKRK